MVLIKVLNKVTDLILKM